MVQLLLASVLLLIPFAEAHGRLMTPISRVGHQRYENDPTGSSSNGGNNNNEWVCRHGTPTVPNVVLNAGETTTLTWFFGAKHVGDCDVYLSYDAAETDRAAMRWFKIANFFDCKAQSDQEPQTLELPSWLPAGNAVLRWGWYALHVRPSIEFYSQCVDVTIANTRTGNAVKAITDIKTYPLINPPVFPLNANNNEYPNRFGPPADSNWMVGPACADGIDSQTNQCHYTAVGTQGHIDVGSTGNGANGGTATAAPTNTETPDTVTGEIGFRCGTDWTNANSKCGTPCPAGNDNECSSGERCFAKLTLACPSDNSDGSEDPVDEGANNLSSCTSWEVQADRNAPSGWCQQTCSNEATAQFCDSDLCECTDDGSSASTVFCLLAGTFALLHW